MSVITNLSSLGHPDWREGRLYCTAQPGVVRNQSHSTEGKMKKKSLPRGPFANSAPTNPTEYLRHFDQLKDEIVETAQRLVEIESPSDVKQAVDRVGTVIAGRFDAIGGRVTFHPAEKF